MLETHRIDERIKAALGGPQNGLTAIEIHERVTRAANESVSIDAIKRHIPGLVKLGVLRGVKEFRNERLVTVWLLAE